MPKLLKPLSVLAVALSMAFPAHAAITSAKSEGEALSVGVELLGLNLLSVDASKVQGSTPGNYNVIDTTSLNLNPNLIVASANLSTGILTGQASFNGATAYGYGGIVGLNLGVTALLPILSLSLDALYSSSSVTGDWGSLSATGDSTLANAKLSLLGSSLLTLDAHPAPNTVVDIGGLLGFVGVHLVLNEQIGGTCTSFACSIETNALHLWVDPLNLDLAGVDVTLGHSMAQVTAVPEPSEMALLLAGLGLLGAAARKRRSQAA